MGYTRQIKLLIQWAPALNYVVAITAAPPGRERIYRAMELLDYLATQTPSPLDDEALAVVRAVLLTPQGGLLLDYMSAKIQPLFQDTPDGKK
jgi:hypothetical protein